MQQQNVFLLDTCFWLISAIIIYLTYPIIYHIIWAIIISNYYKYPRVGQFFTALRCTPKGGLAYLKK